MDLFNKSIPAIFLVGIILFVSGCISQPAGNTASSVIMTEQSLKESTSQYIGDHHYWIKINPVRDFQSESPFTVTGITKFNITGTTNYPEGSRFWVKIVEEERSRNLRSEVLIPSSVNSAGVNAFSYPFDIQGNPPAHYRVEIRKANQNLTATEQYRIILNPSKEKWLWVHINPIRWNQEGENLNITGTTNLLVGSEIFIESFVKPHTCPQPPPGAPPIKNTGGERTYCNRGCNEHLRSTVPVTEGNAGINSWKYTLNTSDWCTNERYSVSAGVRNWTNVTRDYQEFPFG